MVLPKENHMQLTEAATLDRKSGKPRDLQFRGPFVEMFFDRAYLSRRAVEGPAVFLFRSSADSKAVMSPPAARESLPNYCHG